MTIHTVSGSDDFSSIAKKYRVPLDELKRMNAYYNGGDVIGLSYSSRNYRVFKGDRVLIPPKGNLVRTFSGKPKAKAKKMHKVVRIRFWPLSVKNVQCLMWSMVLINLRLRARKRLVTALQWLKTRQG